MASIANFWSLPEGNYFKMLQMFSSQALHPTVAWLPANSLPAAPCSYEVIMMVDPGAERCGKPMVYLGK